MFTIAGLTLLIAGVVMLTRSMIALNLYKQSNEWPKVSATIINSFAQPIANDGETSYRPIIEFNYSINGIEYCSNRHSEGLPFPVTEQSVRMLVSKYPIGKIVPAAVKPDEPMFAILDTGPPQHMIAIKKIGGLALLFGVLFLTVAIITHI